jgi:hypothetical protein
MISYQASLTSKVQVWNFMKRITAMHRQRRGSALITATERKAETSFPFKNVVFVFKESKTKVLCQSIGPHTQNNTNWQLLTRNLQPYTISPTCQT